MNIKEKVLNDFAQRNQYSNWKEVVKDKQSMTFEAKEFEEEIDLTLTERKKEEKKVIDDGISDMKFMIKQGKYKQQAENGLQVLISLKKKLGLK